MIQGRLPQLAQALSLSTPLPDLEFSGLSTNTRTLQPGNLFLALRGERFDAHEFVAQAQQQGAVAAIVQRQLPDIELPQLLVSDTLQALGQVAHYWRQQFSLPVAAITGSSGKTTVKTMLADIMACVGPVHATAGNLNNAIGAPLTLLQLAAEHQSAVIELGANHAGEIDYTASLTEPTVAMITNVAPAHLEGFGSVQGIASAKAEIFDHLRPGGVAVVNADDEFAEYWLGRLGGTQVRSFSLQGLADVRAAHIQLTAQGSQFVLQTWQGDIPIQLSILGQHNVMNALAAATTALVMGASLADIQQGLANMRPVAGRLATYTGAWGGVLVDDSYNANVGSVTAALSLLSQLPGPRLLVLGALGELGEQSEALHRQLGETARAQGIDQIWAVGAACQSVLAGFAGDGHYFESNQALLAALREQMPAGASVLVKGSRSAAMETVLNGLKTITMER